MKNPFLKQLYTFDRTGTHWDVPYVFDPSPRLAGLLSSLNEGEQLRFEITPEGDLQWTVVSDNPPGWRVRVGDARVYLYIEAQPMAPRDAAVLAGKVHMALLGSRMYQTHHADILDYWRKPDDEYNNAQSYASDSALDRSMYLENLIKTHCGPISSALEVGCNIGRNINYLHGAMGIEVAGLEISEHALELLKTQYPAIANVALYPGDAATRIKEIPDARYDLVYSMAVLMHIHPNSAESLWADIARVAGKYIITIENETSNSDRNWYRNYQEVFEPFGPQQIHTEIPPASIPAFGGYRTRIFRTGRQRSLIPPSNK